MLDSPGEWFYDRTGKFLYAWMPDSTKPAIPVLAGQLPVGIDLHARSHVQVDGLTIRLVGTGVNMRSTTGVAVRNSRIEDTVDMGIDAATSVQASVETNAFARTGSDAISGQASNAGPSTGMRVVNNSITSGGVIMNGDVVASLPRRNYAAIRSGGQSFVSGNVIRDSGYIGIWPLIGSTVTGNYVFGTCSVLDDCGGVYTSEFNNKSTISNNIVEHVRGAIDGKSPTQSYTQAQGIYLDESASGVTVTGNTVFDADNGIQLHVAASNVIVNNKLYGNRRNQLWLQETRNKINPAGDLFGNVIVGNQSVPTSANACGVLQETQISSTVAFAQYDVNKYFDRIFTRIATEKTPTTLNDYTLPLWQAALTSTGAPRTLDTNGHGTSEALYAASLVTGSNIVPNGHLATNAAGWATWNQTAPHGSMVREACTPGYCARYITGGSPGILSSPNFSVKQDQWYRLTLDLMTGSDGQAVQVLVRRGGGGLNKYESLSNISLYTTGNRSWKRYSAVFKAVKTVNVNDPVTLDRGARVDFQNITPGQMLSVANVEIVPTTAADSTTRTDLLVNSGPAPIQVACPLASTTPASCAKYVRFSDDTPVSWPHYLLALGTEIVYTRDSSLIDSDGDGIADSQDHCPGTLKGAAVNASGCDITQR